MSVSCRHNKTFLGTVPTKMDTDFQIFKILWFFYLFVFNVYFFNAVVVNDLLPAPQKKASTKFEILTTCIPVYSLALSMLYISFFYKYLFLHLQVSDTNLQIAGRVIIATLTIYEKCKNVPKHAISGLHRELLKDVQCINAMYETCKNIDGYSRFLCQF